MLLRAFFFLFWRKPVLFFSIFGVSASITGLTIRAMVGDIALLGPGSSHSAAERWGKFKSLPARQRSDARASVTRCARLYVVAGVMRLRHAGLTSKI